MKQYEKGQILADRYELIEAIGKGGMASVFKAFDIYTKTIVAVKILAPEIVLKPVGQERFEVEKEAFAKLGLNPNVVKLFDVIQSGDEWYIILECVEGGTLKDKYQNFGAMTLRELKYYFSKICDALSEAHKLKIIHRDIKPDNVLLTQSGEVKLGDFGISVMEDRSTETEKAIGTPKYMPPEIIAAQKATPKSDIYSLGIMLYEFSTGIAPFIHKEANGIALKHLKETPTLPKLINPSIPQSLENIILKMIEKEPLYRYESVDEVKRDLLKVKQTDSPKPYNYHKKVTLNMKEGQKTIKVGTTYDKLPVIAKSAFSFSFTLIFLFLILILVAVLVFI
ncbi:serine/threonine-protein kinase [Spiroplasma taiwanense]|uniref:Serine/threonine protein kinase n=1 Tax=Spiroplasma taiwanense CT-1 TaxID=1276220 RepID=S5LUP3_9MOLU|nr:serine/threonine-protein kinase [Spiroplasma taiwanense]AGR41524.1 serine/threonine protein kinase [Spiroplasma taiwanense CT-1]